MTAKTPARDLAAEIAFLTRALKAPTQWFVVITFTISKLGTYHMNRLKLEYVYRSHRGWQYQYLYTTITLVNPPLPGSVPIPRTAICW